MKHPGKIRIIEPFISLIVFAVALVYMVNVLNTGNWLWFRSTATHVRPSRIIVIDHGERIVMGPGHSQFNALADAVEVSLSKLNNTDLISVGLSEQTLADYNNNSLVLELYFDQPVVFNSIARTGEPTQLLIPIEGRHAGGGYVFRGAQGEWWHGAIRMANPAPLMSALTQLGYEVAFVQ
ncbi:MAG: hypothetical protein DWQ04_02650 [Chloroflexi bacterium]|nr:MAG: hypothetical protein DWQ04_02650 [Chloroflexota bacterium]